MEINYTFYFFAFFEKVIKKLLTFCYWQDLKVDSGELWRTAGSFRYGFSLFKMSTQRVGILNYNPPASRVVTIVIRKNHLSVL